jgi:hypothetical protein
MKGLLPESFLKRYRGKRKQRRGGKSLKVVFSDKNSPAWCFRAILGAPLPRETAKRLVEMRLCGAGPQVLQQPGQEVAVRVT